MIKTMVAGILLAVFASCVFAQEPAPVVSVRGGCGPSDAYFDVKTDRKQHPVTTPDAGKALVYVFEDMEHGPTMRVGLDGAWVGANKGKSYFFFSVDPGDHQVCTNWQSGTFKETSKRIGSAITLKAEAGKVYYLRTQVYERSEQDRNVKLEPVETAEGQFLVSASAFSSSHPKK
jgi:Protein of unknown function (DUF2846)